MKKVVTTIAVFIAALSLAGVAAAATPQGKLTGEIKFHPSDDPFGDIHKVTITSPILDGETQYVNVANDKSGDCDGDVGTVEIQYNHGGGTTSYPITCAHFSSSPSPTMTFSWFDTELNSQPDMYVIISVVDKAGPGGAIKFNGEVSAPSALAWVNLGTQGSGHSANPLILAAQTQFGDLSATASQA